MHITITGRHIEVPQSVKDYVEKKISKLDKYFNRLIEVHVIIDKQRELYITEANIIGSNMRIFAKEESTDIHASVDKLIDTASKQLKTRRDKLKTHKIGRFLENVSPFKKREALPKEKGRIIISKYDATKPKTTSEAIAEMELFKTEFFVFRNAETNEINVVYKKANGSIELLEPQS